MPKLNRFFLNIFGNLAGPSQVAVFGSLFAGAPATTTNPQTAQSLSNWLTGWNGAAIGGNAPAIEDMNAAFFVMCYVLAYVLEQGTPEWNAATNYFIGSFVQVNGVLYKSRTDNNLANAVTDTTNWMILTENLSAAPKLVNYTLDAQDGVVEFDTTAVDLIATVPAASAGYRQKKFTIVKFDSSANEVVVSGGYSIRLQAQYDNITLFCNGSAWYQI